MAGGVAAELRNGGSGGPSGLDESAARFPICGVRVGGASFLIFGFFTLLVLSLIIHHYQNTLDGKSSSATVSFDSTKRFCE